MSFFIIVPRIAILLVSYPVRTEKAKHVMPTLVFLDFDGVICDSALECLVSSWEAYFRDHGRDAPKAVPVDLKERFLALRPYVRSGEDSVASGTNRSASSCGRLT